MNKISITYDDNLDAARSIVDSQGHCTSLNICSKCPFFTECFASIRDNASFLPQEIRVRKAEEFLFTIALEQEIG